MDKVKGMRTCAICGRDFPLIAEETYIARDKGRTGIVNAVENKEVTIYDAIDCPHCGCQTILQERKRYASPADIGIEDDLEDDLEDDPEDDPDDDLCEGCEYEEFSGLEEPCKSCSRCYCDVYTEAKKDGLK